MELDRREFTVLGVAAASTLAGTQAQAAAAPAAEPWYKRCRRYGQINITEDDAGNMDVGFWRKYWKDTKTQAMIINAGGVVAYYPTKIPYALKAYSLGNRDLLGELAKACKEDGVEFVARMTNSAVSGVAQAHPDWMCMDAQGNRTNQACMNGGFIYEYIPAVMKEIIAGYHPAGFGVNGGGGHNNFLCYCQVCTKLFKDKFGEDLPKKADWEDPVYRQWVTWNSDQFVTLWTMFNKVTQTAGGKDCIWIGMNGGSFTARGMTNILKIAPLMLQDHQARSDESGFQQMPEDGKTTHGVMGWDKIVTASEAIYGPRMTTKAAPEAQMWMYEGIAGDITPWWHTISAHHDDKRRYATVPPVFNWHATNEEYFYNRRPVASVGIVWSDENNVFYGRDDITGNVESPWRGVINSLVRARIPYIVIHANDIDRDSVGLSALILPNLAAMTDTQVASVKRFVAAGGGLFATGDTSLHDQFGDVRTDYALADLFGAHWIPGTKPNTGYAAAAGGRGGRGGPAVTGNAALGRAQARVAQRPININTYLRFTPELRANVAYSPHPAGEEPPVPPGAVRHPILKGFDETDVIFFGGVVPAIKTDPGVQVLVTFIPEAPTSQAENAYWRTPKTDIQGLLTNAPPGGGRVVFMPADVDRQYASDNNPDHGDLIANAIRWAAKDNVPLAVEGAGLVDCNLYQQSGRMVLHVANLVSAATWRAPLDEYVAIGPFTVRVKLNKDVQGQNVKLLVSGQPASASVSDGWAEVKIPSISSHEVVVIA